MGSSQAMDGTNVFCIGRKVLYQLSHLGSSSITEEKLNVWEKAMAPHSSILAWQIPWTEEPGGLQSMGSLRVGYN